MAVLVRVQYPNLDLGEYAEREARLINVKASKAEVLSLTMNGCSVIS
jgi:hypothetical protein